jgi:hypothetical protein
MIPKLQDPQVAADGEILAATVVLRMYEMLECKWAIYLAFLL